eukprot:8516146-Heterocapsa_arctica.AAC.2
MAPDDLAHAVGGEGDEDLVVRHNAWPMRMRSCTAFGWVAARPDGVLAPRLRLLRELSLALQPIGCPLVLGKRGLVDVTGQEEDAQQVRGSAASSNEALGEGLLAWRPQLAGRQLSAMHVHAAHRDQERPAAHPSRGKHVRGLPAHGARRGLLARVDVHVLVLGRVPEAQVAAVVLPLGSALQQLDHLLLRLQREGDLGAA